MIHLSNYTQNLIFEHERALKLEDEQRQKMKEAHAAFIKKLPPDESPFEVSEDSLREASILAAREQWRTEHNAWCNRMSDLDEIEDELFEWPENRHQ